MLNLAFFLLRLLLKTFNDDFSLTRNQEGG